MIDERVDELYNEALQAMKNYTNRKIKQPKTVMITVVMESKDKEEPK